MLKARASFAAQIANIDPQWLNQIIFEGKYPCAPKTVRGSSRIFNEIDLIVLFIYGVYLKKYPAGLAGYLACKIHGQLTETPDEAEIVLVLLMNGAWHAIDGSSFKGHAHSFNGAFVLETRYIDIENVRAHVRNEVADEEARGADDSDED